MTKRDLRETLKPFLQQIIDLSVWVDSECNNGIDNQIDLLNENLKMLGYKVQIKSYGDDYKVKWSLEDL